MRRWTLRRWTLRRWTLRRSASLRNRVAAACVALRRSERCVALLCVAYVAKPGSPASLYLRRVRRDASLSCVAVRR